MKHESFNESIEMYLKTAIELANRDDPVPISALAQRLGVSNVSATEMVHRLQKLGLVEHTPYKGINLTENGYLRATRIIRRHRLWERFLADKLNLPWEQVYEFACRLEHVTDSAVTEALAVFLDHPQTCPHGNPIPTADGATTPAAGVPLTDLEPGQGGAIEHIYPENTLLLDYLAARNLIPGQQILVEEIAPFNGPIIIAAGAKTHALGREIAGHLFVTPDNKI